MLKYPLHQFDPRYSVWLELRRRDELVDAIRESTWSLSDEMKQRDAVAVYSPYDHHITHTIPYSSLLAAFPDVDPETVYLVMHFE